MRQALPPPQNRPRARWHRARPHGKLRRVVADGVFPGAALRILRSL